MEVYCVFLADDSVSEVGQRSIEFIGHGGSALKPLDPLLAFLVEIDSEDHLMKTVEEVGGLQLDVDEDIKSELFLEGLEVFGEVGPEFEEGVDQFYLVGPQFLTGSHQVPVELFECLSSTLVSLLEGLGKGYFSGGKEGWSYVPDFH